MIERNTGVLFQDGALFSSLTVGENVQVPLKEYHRDLPDSLRYELALLKVKLAGLPADAINKLPSQLSGGMRKRAGLARALALDPPLLFLDEPTAGLDPIGAAAFDHLIRTLQQALGLTVFLITHDLDTLYAICDRVAVLADRKVVVCAPMRGGRALRPPVGAGIFPRPARARRAGGTTRARGELSMETKANYVLIGAFTLVVTLFAAAVRAVGGELLVREGLAASTRVVFNEPVTGLSRRQPGAATTASRSAPSSRCAWRRTTRAA